MSDSIPPDDPARDLVVTGADAPGAVHISVAGDTYTMLVTGGQTAGRYCLIDMHVPDGGGPPLHRHDFEEMFTVLDGEIEFVFRGTTTRAGAGTTVNIPANAPHHFRNRSGRAARMLCMCTPAGQDEYFTRVGDPVGSRTAPPPDLTPDDIDERRRLAAELAPRYATEMLP
jgi:quercetin dioxygenase-like cupin family protein